MVVFRTIDGIIRPFNSDYDDCHTKKEKKNKPTDYSHIKTPYNNKLGYTVPNAYCPICGVQVFFYQSPYGGVVFFDELGPPWPKHPCMDNSSNPRQVRRFKDDDFTEKSYSWIRDKWQPVIVKSTKWSNNIVYIESIYGVIYSFPHKDLIRSKITRNLLPASLIQEKHIKKNYSELSIYVGYKRQLKVIAYLETDNSKKNTKSNKNKQPKLKSVQSKTAMQIAFENAKKDSK